MTRTLQQNRSPARVQAQAELARAWTLPALLPHARSGGLALDMGCGTGDLARCLVERASMTVAAIDPDASLVDWAVQQNCRGISYMLADGVTLPFADNLFDLVVSRFVLGNIRNRGAAIDELIRVTKPGGTVLVEDLDYSAYRTFPFAAAFEQFLKLLMQLRHSRGSWWDGGLRVYGELLNRPVVLGEVGSTTPMYVGLDLGKWAPAAALHEAGHEVVEKGLATRQEVEELTRSMERLAQDPAVLLQQPTAVRVWARKVD